MSASRSHRRARRPAVEALEGRIALSITAPLGVFADPSNRTAFGEPAVATSPLNGNYVVVSTAKNLDSGQTDIYAGLFDRNHNPIAAQITVANSRMGESNPDVAMASDGSFVVTWRRGLAGGGTTVLGARFDAQGEKLRQFAVPNMPANESDGHVTVLDNDQFVVTFTAITGGSVARGITSSKVMGAIYRAGGSLKQLVTIANGPGVNHQADVSGRLTGTFDVAYASGSDTAHTKIMYARFGADGRPVAAAQVVDNAFAINPSISTSLIEVGAIAYQRVGLDLAGNGLFRPAVRTLLPGGTLDKTYDLAQEIAPAHAISVSVPYFAVFPTFVVAADTSSPFGPRGSGYFNAYEYDAQGNKTLVASSFHDGSIGGFSGFPTDFDYAPAVSVASDGSYVIAYRHDLDGSASSGGPSTLRVAVGALS
jgi:hypothetical protein